MVRVKQVESRKLTQWRVLLFPPALTWRVFIVVYMFFFVFAPSRLQPSSSCWRKQCLEGDCCLERNRGRLITPTYHANLL